MRNHTGEEQGRWLISLALLGIVLAALAILPASAGTIVGTVNLTGTAPAGKTTAVGQDTDICGTEQQTADVVVGPGAGIQWAAVWVSSASGATASPEPPKLDQNGCTFDPKVIIVRPGEEMAVMNSDGILHNVHTYSEKNTPMNKAQPGFVKTMPLTFDKAEVIQVRCDVHGWMKAWIVVVDSPYAVVTDERGSFSLAGVPAGTHQLTVWHGALGEQTQEVTVSEGKETSVRFELSAD